MVHAYAELPGTATHGCFWYSRHNKKDAAVQKYVLHLKDDACDPFSNPSIQSAIPLPEIRVAAATLGTRTSLL